MRRLRIRVAAALAMSPTRINTAGRLEAGMDAVSGRVAADVAAVPVLGTVLAVVAESGAIEGATEGATDGAMEGSVVGAGVGTGGSGRVTLPASAWMASYTPGAVVAVSVPSPPRVPVAPA
jgi:hypothetical protein